MAFPVAFHEQNSVLLGNPGERDLPVYRDGAQVISCWMLSPSELLAIMATGQVWLRVSGSTHPAVLISGNYPFEQVTN